MNSYQRATPNELKVHSFKLKVASCKLEIPKIRSKDLRIAGDERILGGSDFVTTALRQAREEYDKRMGAKNIDLKDLITLVADYCSVDASLVASTVKQRRVTQARSIIAHLAIDRLRVSGAEVSRQLRISPSAVSRLPVKDGLIPYQIALKRRCSLQVKRRGGIANDKYVTTVFYYAIMLKVNGVNHHGSGISYGCT